MTKTLILAGSVLAASATLDAHVSASRVLTATVPAAQLTHLDLRALDGTVRLKADPNPSATEITVLVAIDPPPAKNFRRPVAANLAAVGIDTRASANVLYLGLTNAGVGNIEATWTITVPARFSARISGHNGSVIVDDITGGVEASLDAGLAGERGTIDVRVPRGRLDLSLGVGNIRASRASTDFSSAVVRATVGDAQLFLLGHEIVAPHEPGPGHRVTLDGNGPETLSLKVSVGDVSLKIG